MVGVGVVDVVSVVVVGVDVDAAVVVPVAHQSILVK